jgi:hypothetical protein
LNVGYVASGRWNSAGNDDPEVGPRLTRLDASATLPIKLNERGDLIVLSPLFERWDIGPLERAGQATGPVISDQLTGFSIPISYVRVIEPDKWKLNITGIGRWMTVDGDAIEGTSYENVSLAGTQIGGVVLLSKTVRPALTWKFGAYVNTDAWGIYGRPLLGIDWRIDDRHNLFGVLPGGATFEHKFSRNFHWGVVFKGITSSYGEVLGDFRRMDENTVGAFMDCYLRPAHIVLRAEAGHSILSRYRGGEDSIYFDDLKDERYVDYDLGDGPYVRVLLAYRLRFDEATTPGE